MKFTDVLIRDEDAVDILDKRIKSAFDNAIAHKEEIPIYYQYGQGATPALVTEKEYYVGKATDIHWDEYNRIICNAIVNMALPIAANFVNVIDNFIIPVIKDDNGNMIPVLKQFIIYDKQFKESIDNKRKNANRVVKTMPSPMDGGTPLETHAMPIDDIDLAEVIESGEGLPEDVKQQLLALGNTSMPEELQNIMEEEMDRANDLKKNVDKLVGAVFGSDEELSEALHNDGHSTEETATAMSTREKNQKMKEFASERPDPCPGTITGKNGEMLEPTAEDRARNMEEYREFLKKTRGYV